MQMRFALAAATLLMAMFGNTQASSRPSFSLDTPNGKVLIDCFASCSDTTRPAVLILSGSKGFGSPAYDEIGKTFRDQGLNAYLVHYLTTSDLSAIDNAGSSAARERYYAKRQAAWIAEVSSVISNFNARPNHVGKVGVLGISLGAEIAAATSANRTDIGALVIVDGGFPDGYSQTVRTLPPLYLVWGSADHTFPLSVGLDLRKLARQLNVTVRLDVYKDGPHDFFLRPGTPQARAAHLSAARFLVSQLAPASQGT